LGGKIQILVPRRVVEVASLRIDDVERLPAFLEPPGAIGVLGGKGGDFRG
jgi:hypothetical protein